MTGHCLKRSRWQKAGAAGALREWNLSPNSLTLSLFHSFSLVLCIICICTPYYLLSSHLPLLSCSLVSILYLICPLSTHPVKPTFSKPGLSQFIFMRFDILVQPHSSVQYIKGTKEKHPHRQGCCQESPGPMTKYIPGPPHLHNQCEDILQFMEVSQINVLKKNIKTFVINVVTPPSEVHFADVRPHPASNPQSPTSQGRRHQRMLQ